MASTFTQNLGIECPATGEQANVWGVTVNRNFATYDMAIKGNTTMSVSTSPVLLNVDNGVSNPQGAYPLIVWTGAQTGTPPGSVSIEPTSRQSLYIMRNQTNGAIQFYQGNAANNFLLQAGYDAIVYSDGGGTGAATAQALGNPQFNNVLIQGNLQMTGGSILNQLTVQGDLSVTGWIAIGSPTSVPEPLTIAGLGQDGQIRLVYGGYGVILRNDGASFHIMVTAQNDPYGQYSGMAFWMDLASHAVGLAGWAANSAYGLSVPSIHAGTLALDATLSVGATLTVGGVINGSAGIHISSGRSYFTNNEPSPVTIALDYDAAASHRTWIGTNVNGQFVVSSAPGGQAFAVDQAGNGWFASGLTVNGGLGVAGNISAGGSISAGAFTTTGSITVNGNISVAGSLSAGSITSSGWIHATAGGFQFPDGTTQSTAATTPPPPPSYTVTPHNVAANRLTNNAYGNPSSNLMWVNVAINLFSGSTVTALVSPSPGAPPTLEVANFQWPGSGDSWASFCFPVPAGYQYQISMSAGTFNINYCVEWY